MNTLLLARDRSVPNGIVATVRCSRAQSAATLEWPRLNTNEGLRPEHRTEDAANFVEVRHRLATLVEVDQLALEVNFPMFEYSSVWLKRTAL